MTNFDIKNAYLGTTKVKAIYEGSTKVWPKVVIQFRPKVGDFVYSDKTWSTNLDDTKICVGVITDVRSSDFDFISLKDLGLGPWSYTIMMHYIDEDNGSVAISNFDGETNTSLIVQDLPGENTAADKCITYSTEGFPAGWWYLPSAGQLQVASSNQNKINASLEVVGGIGVAQRNMHSWCSMEASETDAWCINWNLNRVEAFQKDYHNSIRPFCTYEYFSIPEGIYVCDINNNYFTKEQWAAQGKQSSDAVGIVVVDDDMSYMLNLELLPSSFAFGGYGTLIDAVPMDSEGLEISLRYSSHGIVYTDEIIFQLNNGVGSGNAPAAEQAKNFQFKNGQTGYLPSYGELYDFHFNKSKIDEILSMLGYPLWSDTVIQSSNQYGSDINFVLDMNNSKSYESSKNNPQRVLPFALIPFKDNIEKGVYILDINDNLWSRSKWDTSNNTRAMGVAVVTSNCAICVAKEDDGMSKFTIDSSFNKDLPEVVTTENNLIGSTDFKGLDNTSGIISSDGLADAAIDASAYLWPNNHSNGHLGSLGEWVEVCKNLNEVEACLSLIGGQPLVDNSMKGYWTSTCFDSQWVWTATCDYDSENNIIINNSKKNESNYVRPFLLLNLSEVTIKE